MGLTRRDIALGMTGVGKHWGRAVAIAALVAFTTVSIGAIFVVVLTDRQLAAAEANYGLPAR